MKTISAISGVTRRQFIKSSTVAVGALGALSAASPVFAAGSDKLRIGVVGCGGRGTGAALDCVRSSDGVEIMALGDAFQDRVDGAFDKLGKPADRYNPANAFKVTKDKCFTGLDAYQKVIAAGVDLVILATPPNFRPQHLKAAIEAGKHVFAEKPVAVDPLGVRSVIATAKLAQQKNLAIVTGTQRRHQLRYTEVMKRIKDGAIGELMGGEAYWNGGCPWGARVQAKKPEWTETEYQMRNWYYYAWICGDHVVEQHIHNMDVLNWAMGGPPTEVIAVGGRQWRTGPGHGDIYDHFGASYRYPNGAVVTSMCRQINRTKGLVTEFIKGTKGRARVGMIEGANPYEFKGDERNPYEQEHTDLIASIRAGKPLNEGKQVAESTLTMIMQRMSAYTGQTVTWEFAMNQSDLDLTPPRFKKGDYTFGDMPAPVVPMPGQMELT